MYVCVGPGSTQDDSEGVHLRCLEREKRMVFEREGGGGERAHAPALARSRVRVQAKVDFRQAGQEWEGGKENKTWF